MNLFPATASEIEIAYTICNVVWLIAACINSGYSLEDMYWLRRFRVRDARKGLAWQRFRNNNFRTYIALGASLIGFWAMQVPPSPSPSQQTGAMLTGGYFLSISFFGWVLEWWQYSDRVGMKASYERLKKLKESVYG